MMRFAKFTVAVLVLAFGLDACSGSTTPAAHTGGTLVWAPPWAITTLDPGREGDSTTEIMMGMVYQSLVYVDINDPGKLDPGLAQSWTASAQNTQFTLHLVHNARFSTGNPLTATDVKFSLDRLRNLQAQESFLVQTIKSVDVVDPYTVQITTGGPDAALMAKLSAPDAAIYDSKLAIANGATSDSNAISTDKAEAYFNAPNTLGSGPYLLKLYTPNVEMDLVRNPSYWGPAPSLDKVILKNIPDATTQRQLLERGDIDIAGNFDFATAQQLVGESGINVSFFPSPNMIYFFINTSPAVSKPLSTQLVRQAIAHAIDYNGLLQLANGHARRMPTTIPLGLPGADTVTATQTDLTLAKQLMAQAGYPNGFETKLVFAQTTLLGIDISLVAAKVQSDLAQIGIKLDLQPSTLTEFLTLYRSHNDPIGVSYNTPDYIDTDDFVATYWTTEAAHFAPRVHLVDPQIEALYPQSLATSGDARVQIYKQMQQEMQANPVFFGLLQPDFISAYRTRVKGLKFWWSAQTFDMTKVSVS